MASSSAACVLGGVRLISSASSSPAKSGPAAEGELADALVVDVGAGEVGRQQVGRELRPREVEAERLGEGARGQRLAEPREVLDQHVALGQDRGQHEAQRLLLADHGLADPVEHVRGDARSPRRR